MAIVADYVQEDLAMVIDQGKSEKPVEPNIVDGFNEPQKIRYEVVRDIEGVKACLHLRYLVLRYVNFIEENQDHLDLDAYDYFSTFLGAFSVIDGRKTLVGTLRIINCSNNDEISPHIDKITNDANDPAIRSLAERSNPFPILDSFSIPDKYLAYFNTSKPLENSIRPYEISRLAILPGYWMHNIDIGLHHLLILDSWLEQPPRNDFLIAVHPRSRRRYERVGFKVIPGTKEVLYKHVNQLAIAMSINLEEFLGEPRYYCETCKALFPSFQKTGYFTRMTGKQHP